MSILDTWVSNGTVASFFAILLSPLIAWWVQYWKSKRDTKVARKHEIFRALMLTRGYGQTQALSLQHVNALNGIDIEFYKDKEVLDAWDIYREHLKSYPKDSNISKEQLEVMRVLWLSDRIKYLVNLLYTMAHTLGYSNFNKIILEKKIYVPEAYDSLESEQYWLRKNCINVLNGNQAIKVEVANQNSRTKDQEAKCE